MLRLCLFDAGSALTASHGVSVLPTRLTYGTLDLGRLLSDVRMVLNDIVRLVWR